jgi:hypothetical protein
MDYSSFDECLQALFYEYLPLSRVQSQRVAQLCSGVMLAEHSHLRQIAKWVKDEGELASREQWVRRLLETEFLTCERVYHPLVQHALAGNPRQRWHVIIDRSTLDGKQKDWIVVSLAYRKRAIPLSWACVPYGGVTAEEHIPLLKQCVPLLPKGEPVVLHGDSEFGHGLMRTFAQQQGWDFILGQRNHYQFRFATCQTWQPLASLPVTQQRACYLSKIILTKQTALPPVNLFACYAPARLTPHKRIPERHYYATSLPISHKLRTIGRRRWGTEPFFRDFKSAGWHVNASHLTQPKRFESLLTILATCYLWATCIGRWLCKTGQRSRVDAAAQRHFSFFRLGLDWIVHQYRCGADCPHLLTLYS